MKKDILENIDNVSIYPMMSFAIFGVFFIVMAVYVLKMKKGFVSKMESLPLDQDGTENN